MANEESITITETAPDGTETTISITAFKPDEAGGAGSDELLVEEVFEALLEVEAEEADEADFADEDIYFPAAETNFDETDSNDNTFHRGDYTDIGTGSDGETTYVIGEDFSYIGDS
ncbi:MAG: hypothetical protein R2684_13865 [Pyrinomonadaceae bacterium]